jgi:predicted ester cyclase
MMSDLTSKNKSLMRRVYEEMWNQNRASLAAEFFASPEGVERFITRFLLAFPDLQHTVNDIIAEDDQVAVRFTAHGTHVGQWLHFAPTGLPIQYSGVTVARIASDKIIEHYTWWDKAALMEQIQGGEN